MKEQFIFLLLCIFLLAPSQGQAQLVSVSGYVKNQSNGKMKGNVSVFESISGVGTITNSEGYYRLLLNPGQQKLEISTTGFNAFTSSFTLVSDTTISVELVPYSLTQETNDGAKDRVYEQYVATKTGKESNKGTK